MPAIWAALIFGVFLWYSQPSSASAVPESGLEKAAAASAVIAGSDASSSKGQQQQTDLETRFKRITDTLDRTHGPDLENGDKRQSERLVVADRPPSSYNGGASQSPFMMRNDELGSSGDGPFGDDDEGDDGNGEFGSGDDPFKPDDPAMEPIRPRIAHDPSPVTEGVYPADLDEHTTRKPASTTTTRRPAGGRVTAGATKKPPYVESEHRHPTPKPRPTGSSSSYRTLSPFSLWLRLFVSVSISLSLARLGLGR